MLLFLRAARNFALFMGLFALWNCYMMVNDVKCGNPYELVAVIVFCKLLSLGIAQHHWFTDFRVDFFVVGTVMTEYWMIWLGWTHAMNETCLVKYRTLASAKFIYYFYVSFVVYSGVLLYNLFTIRGTLHEKFISITKVLKSL